RRTEVLEHPCTALGGDPGVVAGGEVVVDDDRVVRCSAEGHRRPRQHEGGSGQRAVGDSDGARMGVGDRGCGGTGRGSRPGGRRGCGPRAASAGLAAASGTEDVPAKTYGDSEDEVPVDGEAGKAEDGDGEFAHWASRSL